MEEARAGRSQVEHGTHHIDCPADDVCSDITVQSTPLWDTTRYISESTVLSIVSWKLDAEASRISMLASEYWDRFKNRNVGAMYSSQE